MLTKIKMLKESQNPKNNIRNSWIDEQTQIWIQIDGYIDNGIYRQIDRQKDRQIDKQTDGGAA